MQVRLQFTSSLVLLGLSAMAFARPSVYRPQSPSNLEGFATFNRLNYPQSPHLLESFNRLNHHLVKLAGDIGERNWLRMGPLNEARDYIVSELNSYGYAVSLEEYVVQGKTCFNVVASLEGTHPRLKQEVVVIGSHYDTAPGTPGADDNASGVALFLELARALKSQAQPRTVRLVAFSTEEAYLFKGLSAEERFATMGSYHHAAASRKRGDRIAGMLSLEMLGYYTDEPRSQRGPSVLRWLFPSRGNFALVVGDLSSAGIVWKAGRGLRAGTALPVQKACLPRFVGGVENSDHRNFWAQGYPAAMVTDTAFYRNGHYHRSTDTVDKLDIRRMASLVPGLLEAVRRLAA
jgi:hypothetical protein